jgi:RNA-directed DNA polymerase
MSFYITISQPPKSHQITLEDILTKELPTYAFQQPTGESYTLTRVANSVTKQTIANARIGHAVQSILEFNEVYKDLFEQPREKLYHTFYIPKKSGGLRRIDEPNPELMGALRRLKEILENDFHAMHHTAAFAYVKGRSTINSLERHQRNHSNWFLKTDFSNFFGSTTLEFALSMLKIIFPFNYVYEQYPDGWKALEKALELGFLNGGLPQGTPVSP